MRLPTQSCYISLETECEDVSFRHHFWFLPCPARCPTKLWIPIGVTVEEEHAREEEAKDVGAIVPMLCYLFLCCCSQEICHFSNNSATSGNFLFLLFSIRYLQSKARRSLPSHDGFPGSNSDHFLSPIIFIPSYL